MHALCASVLRTTAESSDDDDDDDRGPFAVPPGPHTPAPPPPAVVHNADDIPAVAGPMWSVAVADVPGGDKTVARHVAAMTASPSTKSFGGKKAADAASFPLGYVANGRLFMPPWYARRAFPKAVVTSTTYVKGTALRADVTFTGKLFTHPPQQQAMRAYTQHVAANPVCTPCILTLPCGYGKTVLLMAIIAAVRKCALVLAHTVNLVDQLATEARRFLAGAKVVVLTSRSSDKPEDALDADVVVASMQTLLAALDAGKPFVADLFRRVGFVCVDEGHHVVARTFASVLCRVPALYRLVLTATPRRKDGLMPALQMLAGPVVFRAFRRVGEVHAVFAEYKCDEHTVLQRRVGKDVVTDRTRMINKLCDDAARTAAVAAMVVTLVRQRRRVLVVTPRVEHVKALVAAVDAAWPVDDPVYDWGAPPPPTPAAPKKKKKRKAGEVEEEEPPPPAPTRVAGLFADAKEAERATVYSAAVIVSTTQLMEEGISLPFLDTLVQTDNATDPEQVVGRILRAASNKRVPLIVDVWHTAFAPSKYMRGRYYRGEKFAVRHWVLGADNDWSAFDRSAPPTL
jgi:superfamily II DNA or RNA helicase